MDKTAFKLCCKAFGINNPASVSDNKSLRQLNFSAVVAVYLNANRDAGHLVLILRIGYAAPAIVW